MTWNGLCRRAEQTNSEDIEDSPAGEEEKKAGKRRAGVDVSMFSAEISRGEMRLSQVIKAHGAGKYPAQRMREEAIKGRIREICIEMMSDIISKYVSYKQSLS